MAVCGRVAVRFRGRALAWLCVAVRLRGGEHNHSHGLGLRANTLARFSNADGAAANSNSPTITTMCSTRHPSTRTVVVLETQLQPVASSLGGTRRDGERARPVHRDWGTVVGFVLRVRVLVQVRHAPQHRPCVGLRLIRDVQGNVDPRSGRHLFIPCHVPEGGGNLMHPENTHQVNLLPRFAPNNPDAKAFVGLRSYSVGRRFFRPTAQMPRLCRSYVLQCRS